MISPRHILANLHSLQHKNTINAVPPSPTISSSSSWSDDCDDDKKDDHIDIFDVYGTSSTNSNDLSWSNITDTHIYTENEILGAKELQSKLSQSMHITSNINKYLPPFECLRYFLGCSMEIDRAISKWKYSIKMYNEYKMHQITADDVIECFKILSKSIAFGGLDKDKCRIITIKYSLFYFSEYKNINIFLLAGFYLFYYLTHDVVAHRNGICLLCDLNGFSLSNFSFTVEKKGLLFFQKVLPIRIKKVFVLDAPWIAHYALKLVLPLLNDKLRDRVFIVTNKDVYDTKDSADKTIIHDTDLPQLVGGSFDSQYLRHRQDSDSFLYDVLLQYFTKTVDLKHFNVSCDFD
eukprot:17738_1